MLSWVDGRPAAELPLSDRGLAYGDGLFETIAVRGGRAVLLSRHLARLAEGLRRLAVDLDLVTLETELRAFFCELGEGVAKLIITRGDGLRGYAPPQPAQPRRILLGNPLPSYPGVAGELRGDAELALGNRKQAREAYEQSLAALDLASPTRGIVEMKFTAAGGRLPDSPEA